MKLKVVKYDPDNLIHHCLDEADKEHQVDLLVNGDFPEDTCPYSLEGKTLECKYLLPYQEIAMWVTPS